MDSSFLGSRYSRTFILDAVVFSAAILEVHLIKRPSDPIQIWIDRLLDRTTSVSLSLPIRSAIVVVRSLCGLASSVLSILSMYGEEAAVRCVATSPSPLHRVFFTETAVSSSLDLAINHPTAVNRCHLYIEERSDQFTLT
jgi:hypothetical protein